MQNHWTEWQKIEGFEDYEVNNVGTIKRSVSGRYMMRTENQQGIACVHLYRGKVQYIRSVAVIVAKAFLNPPPSEIFDTPIHLDGDRMNCNARNLMWRPRWFAVKFHQQFRSYENRIGPSHRLRDTESEEIFKDELDVACRFGLLARDVFMSASNQESCPITGQIFEIIEEGDI